MQQHFEGLIERVFSWQNDNGSVEADIKHSLESEIAALFEKIVSLKPNFDQPILDCGADSVVIVEFVDQIEKKYQQDFEVEDNTTLRDMARQIEQS